MIARRSLLAGLAGFTLLLSGQSGFAQEGRWSRYTNPALGYSIELPMGQFEIEEGSKNDEGFRLVEVDGSAQIEVLGSDDLEGISPEEIEKFLANAERIGTVTYRAGQTRWFVLSGYYEPEEGETEELIFYTKYLFNPEHTAFAAFEISFPRSEKPRFEDMVTRIEKSLRAPR